MNTHSDQPEISPVVTQAEFNLAPWQKHVKELAQKCVLTDEQKGLFMYHKMGAGKTISLLSIIKNILLNADNDLNCVIFGPENALKDFNVSSNDVATVETIDTGVDVDMSSATPSSHKDIFLKWQTEGRYNLVNFEHFKKIAQNKELVELLQNKVVCIDEAHNVVEFLHQHKDLIPHVYKALDGAKHVILMSGTPIVKRVSDFTAMMKLIDPLKCNDLSVLPANDTEFSVTHMHRSEEDYSSEWIHYRGLFLRDFVLGFFLRGLGAGYAANLTLKWGGQFFPIKKLTEENLFGNWIMQIGDPVMRLMVKNSAEKPVIGTQNAAITTYRNLIENSTYRSADARKLSPLKNYISFFDYANLPAMKPDPRNAEQKRPNDLFYAFPIVHKNGSDNTGGTATNIYVEMTDEQTKLLLKMCSRDPRFGLNKQDRQTLGLTDYDDIHDTAVFERAACRLGATGTARFNVALAILKSYKTQQRPVITNQLLHDKFKEFEAHYNSLRNPSEEETMIYNAAKTTVSEGTEHNQMYNVEINEGANGNPSATLRRMRHGVKYYHASNPDTNILDEKEKKNYRFLPVVSFVNEKTMHEFRDWITTADGGVHGAPIVMTPQNLNETLRQAWKPYLMGRGPLCVILHPDIIEGTSLTMNPCMIAMEVRDGHGIQEQVFARILRRCRTQSNKTSKDIFTTNNVKRGDVRRFEKKIFALVAVPNMSARQKYMDINADRRYNYLWKHNDYTSMTWALKKVRDVTAFLNQQYDGLRYTTLNPNPESLITQRNKVQADTLTLLGTMFAADEDMQCAACEVAAMSEEHNLYLKQAQTPQ